MDTSRPSLKREQALWAEGYRHIAGVDEAGRGAWAGPVVAAAVVLPNDLAIAKRLAAVDDSKRLSPAVRERLYGLVMAEALGVGVGMVAAGRIDAIGILPATRQAMMQAIRRLDLAVDYLLIDHVKLPALSIPQHALPKGDRLILSIAAASVVAKVTRDRLMVELDQSDPLYGFARHKGYGTAEHRRALDQHGPCAEHRLSFQPLSSQQLPLPIPGGRAA